MTSMSRWRPRSTTTSCTSQSELPAVNAPLRGPGRASVGVEPECAGRAPPWAVTPHKGPGSSPPGETGESTGRVLALGCSLVPGGDALGVETTHSGVCVADALRAPGRPSAAIRAVTGPPAWPQGAATRACRDAWLSHGVLLTLRRFDFGRARRWACGAQRTFAGQVGSGVSGCYHTTRGT